MPEKITIFDTTLRDGEQAPGASMNIQQKLEVARQLARLGVDVIEAGFPIASPGDFEAVSRVAEEIDGPIIAALARCRQEDIDRAAQALGKRERRRIHVFLATSKIHRESKLRMTPEQIIKRASEMVAYARTLADDVEFSPEDASRTEREFLAEVVQAVIEAGARTVNIPDTVGYAIPEEFASLIRYLLEHVPNVGEAVISVHCHNDLGLATANSLAAVKAGARQVECTVNGIGERAGNASLEEIVMALRTRNDFFGFETGVNTREIMRTSHLVSAVTGFHVQPNKAIVGANAFRHEAGIHQDGVLKERTTYEIMRPEDIGLSESKLVLGKHSGRHAFRTRLEEMGYRLTEEQLQAAFERFKELCDKKKEVYDEDIEAIVEDQVAAVEETYVLDYIHVVSGISTVPTATIRLRRGEELLEDAASGDGPIDAAYRTINRITGMEAELLEYSLRAVTGGRDAQGEVSVRVRYENDTAAGRGVSTDIVQASARAYLNAINRILYRRRKG